MTSLPPECAAWLAEKCEWGCVPCPPYYVYLSQDMTDTGKGELNECHLTLAGERVVMEWLYQEMGYALIRVPAYDEIGGSLWSWRGGNGLGYASLSRAIHAAVIECWENDWDVKELAEFCDKAFEDYEIGQPLVIAPDPCDKETE